MSVEDIYIFVVNDFYQQKCFMSFDPGMYSSINMHSMVDMYIHLLQN
jgi:hypothetical protein